jgi:hypothetical protein
MKNWLVENTHLMLERCMKSFLRLRPTGVTKVGVNFMIIVFGDFWKFTAKKSALCLKTNVMIKFGE